jgi:hypothetical protein
MKPRKYQTVQVVVIGKSEAVFYLLVKLLFLSPSIYITTTESLRHFRRESPISEDLKRLLQQKNEASESDKPAK